jgi:hypothetical protein
MTRVRVSCTLLLWGLGTANAQRTKPDIDSATLQAHITSEKLMKNLNAFQKLADENGGNRAFGLPGFQASSDYIWHQLANIDGTTVWKQDFPALFNQVKSVDLTVDKEQPLRVVAVSYSPSTPGSGIRADLVLGPEGPAGCNDTSYVNLDVKGKIVLVERYACNETSGTFAGKVLPAARAGASAVIVYRDGTANVTGGRLPGPGPDYVPTGYINRADGLQLASRLSAGERVPAYFQMTQVTETRITHNIIAETDGNPESVVMLGAHLDSVQGGPGINDNGSGSSLLLEVFLATARYRTKNKVRFVWWGAEENGGVGSEFYCTNLTSFPKEADGILAYLNFDMVSRGFFYVGDGDGSTYGDVGAPGSEVIEKIWLDYFKEQGVPTGAGGIGGGSDYEFFRTILNKPIGLLFTGAGEPEDPCYHLACDDIANVDPQMLLLNARVSGWRES